MRLDGRKVLVAILTAAAVAPLLAAEERPDGVEEAEERIHQLREEDRYEEALAELDRASERFPEDPHLHGLYPWIHLHDLNDAETALEWARRLQALFPEVDVGFFWEATTHREEERWEDCIAAFRHSPRFERYHLRSVTHATCLYRADRWPEALAALPGPEQYGTGFERFAGWPLWLEGRIARREILEQRRQELEAAVACTTPGCRGRLLAKLALLAVPQGVELAKRAAKGGSPEVAAAVAGLSEALLEPPDFRRERPQPDPLGGTTMPVAKAISELFELLDALRTEATIPPVEGQYLHEEMLEMAKRYPSAAQPLRLEVDEERRSYSLGAGWIHADGSVDLGFEPGRWYSISGVRDGALTLLSLGMQEEGTVSIVLTYTPWSGGLELRSRTFTDLGREVHVSETTSRLVRVEEERGEER